MDFKTAFFLSGSFKPSVYVSLQADASPNNILLCDHFILILPNKIKPSSFPLTKITGSDILPMLFKALQKQYKSGFAFKW